jgi:hypothetical protein
MKRQYVPKKGDRVKLKDIPSYAAHHITTWAWLEVEYVYTSGMGGNVNVRVLNGNERTDHTVVVGLSELQRPIGWKPEYTITCKDIEQARRVRDDWFKRGIVVWASHDLSSAGRMAYTPVAEDGEPGSPHWQYTGNPVETIAAEDCEQLFRIEILHQWEPELPPTSEKTARRKAIKELRARLEGALGGELHFVPDGVGGKMALCEKTELFYQPQEK